MKGWSRTLNLLDERREEVEIKATTNKRKIEDYCIGRVKSRSFKV